MKYEEKKVSVAIQEGKELPYVWICSLSEVYMGENKKDKNINLEELIEVRFFSENQEIRIFQKDEELHSVQIIEEKGEKTICRTWEIGNPKFGKDVTLCYELKQDEDGQTYIGTSRLKDWKGAKIDG